MSDNRMSIRTRALDVWLALVLFVLTTTALQFASRSEGFARDEGYYFHAAENHAAYYEELSSRLGRGEVKAVRDRSLIIATFHTITSIRR